jgi:hypothetical protein
MKVRKERMKEARMKGEKMEGRGDFKKRERERVYLVVSVSCGLGSIKGIFGDAGSVLVIVGDFSIKSFSFSGFVESWPFSGLCFVVGSGSGTFLVSSGVVGADCTGSVTLVNFGDPSDLFAGFGSVFAGSVFVGPFFGGSLFVGSLFVGSVFAGSVFVGSVFVGSVFADSVFVGSVFVGSVFVGPIFVDSVLGPGFGSVLALSSVVGDDGIGDGSLVGSAFCLLVGGFCLSNRACFQAGNFASPPSPFSAFSSLLGANTCLTPNLLILSVKAVFVSEDSADFSPNLALIPFIAGDVDSDLGGGTSGDLTGVSGVSVSVAFFVSAEIGGKG